MVLGYLVTKLSINHSYGNQMGRFKWLRDCDSELYNPYEDTKAQTNRNVSKFAKQK